MIFRRLKRQGPNPPISASAINGPAEVGEWSSKARAAAPLAMVGTAGGPLIRYAGQPYSSYVAVTTSSISARSGDTPGGGTANLRWFDGTRFVDSGLSYDVLNFSAGDPIASGKYCVIAMIASRYFIVAVEC